MNRIFFVNSSKKRDGRTLIHQKTVERIKRLRSMGELSQAEIAKKLGWASASYSDIECLARRAELYIYIYIYTCFLCCGAPPSPIPRAEFRNP